MSIITAIPEAPPVEDPGWDLDELASADPVDIAELGEAEALSALHAASQAEAMMTAKRLELPYAYHRRKVGDGAADEEWAADIAAADLHQPIRRVARDLDLAQRLVEDLPQTVRWLRAGKLDPGRVRQVVDATLPLTPQQRALVEELIYPAAFGKDPRQLWAFLRRTVLALDPDAATSRARRAKKERHVRVEPDDDGMGWIKALLSADDICSIHDRINASARHVKGADDERCMDEVRADVVRDLLLGAMPPAPDGRHRGATAHIYVTVGAHTLLGLDNLPGELRGYGPLTAEQIRELAYPLKVVWSGVLLDDHGYSKKLADRRYRFTGKLAEFIRLRDDTCAHPGCTTTSEACDLDHLTPYPAGETCADNGCPECRRHHRMKHETDWTIHRTTNGDITWTSPQGTQQTQRAKPIAPPGNDPPPF